MSECAHTMLVGMVLVVRPYVHQIYIQTYKRSEEINFHHLTYLNEARFAHHSALLRLGDWASEASPTLGCSIEILRDMYVYMSVCLVCQINCVGGIT